MNHPKSMFQLSGVHYKYLQVYLARLGASDDREAAFPCMETDGCFLHHAYISAYVCNIYIYI